MNPAGSVLRNPVGQAGQTEVTDGGPLGPEIYSNPVRHTRIKPPARCLPDAVTDTNIAATTWHQDAGVINPEADETQMLSVWLAITDATIENGCLIVERGSHRDD